jgi:hypothetical protein
VENTVAVLPAENTVAVLPAENTVAVLPAENTVAVLQSPPPPPPPPPQGERRLETVVLTLSGAKDESDPASVAALDITLTQNAELHLRPTTDRVSLVLQTPLLARIATHAEDRCTALLADNQRCQLQNTDNDDPNRWCPFHREYHQLLHEEELTWRKNAHEAVRDHYMHWSGPNDQRVELYNRFQASLALRAMITEILYAGESDPGHRGIVSSARRLRDEVAEYLARNLNQGSDGGAAAAAGRRSIRSYMDEFFADLKARETNPQSRRVRMKDLTVDLADVKTLRGFQGGDDDGPELSVSELFGAAGSSAMYDTLLGYPDRLGDLPDLPVIPPVVIPRELTPEEMKKAAVWIVEPGPKPWDEWSEWEPEVERWGGFWRGVKSSAGVLSILWKGLLASEAGFCWVQSVLYPLFIYELELLYSY